jgi:hypothetical protein
VTAHDDGGLKKIKEIIFTCDLFDLNKYLIKIIIKNVV